MKPNLYYPIKPFYVNQKFGENLNAIYASQGLKGHSGIDLKAFHGQPIYAACGGTCYPEIDNHGGNGVLIRTSEYQYIYWHLLQDDAVVHTGQVVKAGDLIGYADNTGTSTGDHLHFGVIPLINTDPNNGYHGAIDPMPYFNGMYAQDINQPPKFQFTKTLKYTPPKLMWNADVKALQSFLKGLNLYNGAIDGIYGKITMAAVIAFQEGHNLLGDGIFGPKSAFEANKLL